MRSALVNESTYIVENICVADPVTPSPYAGLFMIGLEDPIYETQTITQRTIHDSGTIFIINPDGAITLTFPDGITQNFPAGTTIIKNVDGTLETIVYTSKNVMISPGTICDIGWVYDPATEIFAAS